MERRSFLKKSLSATVAAAFGAPLFIPQRAWSRGPASPNSRINIGMIGLGKISWGHRRNLLGNSEVQITAICDVDDGRLSTMEEMARAHYAGAAGQGDYTGVRTFKDFRELLQTPGLDAVIIATPDHWHAVIAIAAMRAGLDVYCEKPMAATVVEGRAMVETAKQFGSVVQIGSQQRSEHSFRFASELARRGYLGEMTATYAAISNQRAVFCNLPAQPVPEGLDWDMWIGPSPWRPYHEKLAPPGEGNTYGWPRWRDYLNYGEGNICDWTPHHPDIVAWALDYDALGPVEVIPPDGNEIRAVTYIWPNGVPMTLSRPPESIDLGGSVTFVGTEGVAAASRHGYLKTFPESLAEVQLPPVRDALYLSDDHHLNWLECIRTRRPCVCPPEAGQRSATLGHLGNWAQRFGQTLEWDAVNERVRNVDFVNRFLSRQLRAPWTL